MVHAQTPLSTHADVSNGDKGLIFGQNLPIDVYARSEGSAETARMHRLVGALAARQCEKYQNFACWPLCKLHLMS